MHALVHPTAARPLESKASAYAVAHRRRFVAELQDFVRFPSVSAQPRHAPDVRRCAAWLAGHLRQIGLEGVQVVATARHPLVYAEWRHAPGRPTLLIYGHYDVQPAEPINQWYRPPFSPVVRGNALYGRGASDDKGQMFAHVKALEAYLRTAERLPLNVCCLFEGEEEIGSPHLLPYLRRQGATCRADVAVLSDMPILAPDRPAITYALRGGLGVELEMRGQDRDLHSGLFGGAILNPLQALCEVIAALHHADGRVAIPGFYDCVRQPSVAERAYLARTGPSDARILRDAGARVGWGERGYTLHERTVLRPAATINGLGGGYQGTGGKAVIPASASAKLSFRLVPDQEPEEIDRLLRRYVAHTTPPGLHCAVRTRLRARPVVLDRAHPAVRAAALAYREGFGAAPVFARSGGTIPVVSMIEQELAIPTVMMGFALPDDRMHAPNERFQLPNFYRGIATSIAFMALVGATEE